MAVAETRKADDHAATLLALAARGMLARLVPGADAWDQKIRRELDGSALVLFRSDAGQAPK
jgi:hypothetical protein